MKFRSTFDRKIQLSKIRKYKVHNLFAFRKKYCFSTKIVLLIVFFYENVKKMPVLILNDFLNNLRVSSCRKKTKQKTFSQSNFFLYLPFL